MEALILQERLHKREGPHLFEDVRCDVIGPQASLDDDHSRLANFKYTQDDPRTAMNGRGSFLTLLFGIPFAPELTKSWPYEVGGSAGISHMGSLAQKVLTFTANLAHSG